jgi:hypothetical protein
MHHCSRLIFSINYDCNTATISHSARTYHLQAMTHECAWNGRISAFFFWVILAFTDVHYPAKAEETAPFNRVVAAIPFKKLPAPSPSLTTCSHLHLQHRPPRNVAGRSWFSVSPDFSISDRRAYVFKFVRQHSGPKVLTFCLKGRLLLQLGNVGSPLLYRPARFHPSRIFIFSTGLFEMWLDATDFQSNLIFLSPIGELMSLNLWDCTPASRFSRFAWKGDYYFDSVTLDLHCFTCLLAFIREFSYIYVGWAHAWCFI